MTRAIAELNLPGTPTKHVGILGGSKLHWLPKPKSALSCEGIPMDSQMEAPI